MNNTRKMWVNGIKGCNQDNHNSTETMTEDPSCQSTNLATTQV